ncbi:IS607 family transposase [Moraxella sp. ZJ142]|uniref:IS607 family transposase n=1 Tax=Moraxella marmotae TaxID=3344520 RepID=UPI0035D48FE6
MMSLLNNRLFYMFSHHDLKKPRYRPTDVARFVGVHYRTIVEWDKKQGLFYRDEKDRRWITREDLVELLKQQNLWVDSEDGFDVIYCRVSSQGQKEKGDLDRQVSFALESVKDLKNPQVIKDVGSALDDKRQGLHELLDLVVAGKVNRVFVASKDRLTRFGFNYLDKMFQAHGVEVVVLHQSPNQSAEQELVDDMMSLVVSFSGQLSVEKNDILQQAEQAKPVDLKQIMEGV